MRRMRHPIDVPAWSRREHFQFFKAFTEPFWGLTVELRCDRSWEASRAPGASFYLRYLHAALSAANAVEAFCLRFSGDTVWRYDRVDVSATVDRIDGTFGFSYVPFDPDFTRFADAARAEWARVRATTGLALAQRDAAVVHASALPWVSFTSLSHARNLATDDASPKLAFGRVVERDGARWLPIAIHVHHGLVDGIDVGRFVERLEATL